MAGALFAAAVCRRLKSAEKQARMERMNDKTASCAEPCCTEPAPLKHSEQFKYHVCCKLLKLACVAPFIHLLIHALAFVGINIPHPEFISFIP